MALFGEKYGESVRVVTIGSFSKELCGGTHCSGTGEIGLFLLTHERGVASGTRRVEALTGEGSLEKSRSDHQILKGMEELLSVPRHEVLAEFGRRMEVARAIKRELEDKRVRAMRAELTRQAANAETVGGVNLLAARVDGLGSQEARVLATTCAGCWDRGSSSWAVRTETKLDPGRRHRRPQGEDRGGRSGEGAARIIGGGGGGRSDIAEAGAEIPPTRRGPARRS
jgi:alanyl-tRNA synthetase